MKISQRARYAVQATLDLAQQGAAVRDARSAEVARRTGVPEKFLEAVLLDLRQAGLVASKRGPDGGHRLAVDPLRVTVLAVVEAIDGPLAATTAGRRAEICIEALWKQVETAVRDVLGAVTLEDLRREADAPAPADFTI